MPRGCFDAVSQTDGAGAVTDVYAPEPVVGQGHPQALWVGIGIGIGVDGHDGRPAHAWRVRQRFGDQEVVGYFYRCE